MHQNPVAVGGVEGRIRIGQSVGVTFVDLDALGCMCSLTRLLDKIGCSVQSDYRAGFAYGFSQEWQKDAAPAAHFQYPLAWTKRKEVQAAIRSFTQQGHGGDLI
jgi:hypothetical protein